MLWTAESAARSPTRQVTRLGPSKVESADSTLQSISRTQGAAGSATAALLTTFTTVADGTKNEGRIASITQSGLSGGNVAYSYAYDDHGRVASFTSPAGPRTYAYDTFDQVTGATGGTQTAEAFTYDKNGNRTGSGAIIGAYNRITDDGTYTYQYDKDGNRTRRTLKSNGEYEVYAWDYRQRLVSVTKKNASNVTQQTVTYEYDGLNRRIRRTVQNAAHTVTDKQRFLYDTNVLNASFDEVVIVLDELVTGQSYQKVDHRYLNGSAIDQVFADETPGDSVLWYLSDQQNTVRDVAKYASTTAGSQATIRNHLEYDSFGNVTSTDDPTTGTANDGDQPGFEGVGNEYSPQRSYTGREPDSTTGLIYYRARWFDPQLGRFISEDPIGFAAGDVNLSRYVGNSTPNAVDPSGLDDVLLKDGSIADDSTIRGQAAISEIGLMFPTGTTATVPSEFLPPKRDPRAYSSLTIAVTDGEDSVTRIARAYNFGLSEFDLTVPPDATAPACLDAHGKILAALPGDVVFAWVVFTGHGNPGRFSDNGYSVFDLPTLSNPHSSQALFLEALNKKCSEHTIIDLRLCNIAGGRTGKPFLIKFSELTGCRVIGYSDVYAVLPHGDAYMAHPDGRYELIESFPPYKPYYPFGRQVPEQVPVEVLGRGSLPGEPGPFGIPSVPSRAEKRK